MASVVLDASAVLAVLNAETGAEIVIAALDDAVISAVNFAEVVSKLVERGAGLADIREAFTGIDARVVDFDLALAERAGTLRAETRHLGLSLGDRACLALAEREGAPALTCDRSWIDAVSGIEARAIR
jgi:PIN domain nuclease of toxin-antitoxin system